MAALGGAALYLLSHDVLRASSHWTGINWSVAWLAWGLFAALRGRAALSGALFALGATTGFYVFPGALMTGTLLFVVRRADALRFAGAFALPFLAINGAFWALGGDAYLDGVYRYHLMKPDLEGQTLMDRLPSILFHDFFLIVGPLFLLPRLASGLGREHGRGRRPALGELLDPARHPFEATGRWCVLFAAGTLFFLALLGQVFHFYFLLLFPACAVCGGLFLSWWREVLDDALRRRRRLGLAASLCGAVAVGFLVYPSFEYRLPYFARQRGTTKSYAFPESPLPSAVQSAVKALFWHPDRTIGHRYSGIRYYLWHESRRFAEVDAIASRLRERARSGELLFGDSTTTPLLALQSDVPLVFHMSDTNGMRFTSGITPPEEAIARLRGSYGDPEGSLEWALVNPRRGFYRIEPLRRFIEEDFVVVEEFPTHHHGTYRLLRRR